MSSMSLYLQNKTLNDNLQNAFVALFTGSNEVDGASYERQPISFLEADDGQTSNTEDVLFPIVEEYWGDITHVAIYDSQTNGNLLFKEIADYVKEMDVSGQYRIPKNYLIIRSKK